MPLTAPWLPLALGVRVPLTALTWIPSLCRERYGGMNEGGRIDSPRMDSPPRRDGRGMDRLLGGSWGDVRGMRDSPPRGIMGRVPPVVDRDRSLSPRSKEVQRELQAARERRMTGEGPRGCAFPAILMHEFPAKLMLGFPPN